MDLESVYEQSKTSDGRTFLSNEIVLLKICDDFVSSNVTFQFDADSLTQRFRILRNMCINSHQNAAFIMKYRSNDGIGIFMSCQSVLRQYTTNLLLSDCDTPEVSTILISMSQFFSNYATNGIEFAHDALSHDSALLDILVLSIKTKSFKSINGVITLMYNSLIKFHEKCKSEDVINIISCYRLFFCQLLLNFVKFNADTSSSDELSCLEWIHLLGQFLISNGYIKFLYDSLASNSETEIFYINHEQIILLKIAVSILSNPSYVKELKEKNSNLVTVDEFILTGAEILKSFRVHWNEIFIDSTCDSFNHYRRSLILDGVYVILELISIYLSQVRIDAVHLRDNLVRVDLIEFAEIFLRNPFYAGSEEEILQFKDDVIEVIRLLGNLCFQCRSAQDKLRENGLLDVILAKTATDFNYPLAREWSSLCIRNACENNESNQEYLRNRQRHQTNN